MIKLLESILPIHCVMSIFNHDAHNIVSEKGSKILKKIVDGDKKSLYLCTVENDSQSL